MSKKFTYRNKSQTMQSLIGYGRVIPGGTIETDNPVDNPNFKLVDAGRMTGVEAPPEQPKPDTSIKKGSKK